MNLLRKIRALFRKAKLDAEMAEEMRAHLELQEQQNLARGLAPDEARYAAQRSFGGVEQIKERCRDQRGWVWLEQLGKDVRLAARTLRKQPGFATVAVGTLAVGMAATAALFGVVKGLLLDPLPYPDSGRLVALWRKDITAVLDHMPLTTADYFDLRDRAGSLAELGVFSVRRYNLGGDRPEGIEGALVSAGLFPALGVPPLHGRWFTTADEQGDATAVVMLSHALWQQRFAADPAVVGRTLRLDGRDHTIVGVMPESFALLSLWTRDRTLGVWTLLAPRRDRAAGGYWLGAIARLRPGVTSGEAAAELKTLARELAAADPARDPHKTIWAVPLGLELGGLPALRVSVLLGAGWTLLVLAANNVAGMLLARGLGRQPEMAVRIALGARRGHILRLVLMESLLLSVLASGAGLVLSLWFLSALEGLLPSEVLPRSGLHLDAGVLGSIAVLTLISTQMAGLAPALLAARTEVVGNLKEAGSHASQARRTQRRLRRLVITQIAIALLLVALALQLSGTYRQMLASSRALVSESVLTAAVAAKGPAYAGDAARVAFWRRLLEQCAALPGVREAAVTTKLPLDGGVSIPVLVDEQMFNPAAARIWVEESGVSPGFFPAVGARLLHGRWLEAADDARPRGVVVVNRAFVRRFWPEQNPLGRRVRPAQAGNAWSAEVVGVIEDIRQTAERPARPEVYFPFAAAPRAESFLLVRANAGLPVPVEAVRQELGRIDGDLALASVRTLGSVFHAQSRVFTVVTSLVDALTVAILGLAAVGLYGTLSFHFAQRRRDLGIRMAMGATARDILRIVFRQAVVWVGWGLGAGAVGAWMLGAVLQRMLPGASPFDAFGVALGALVVLAVALLAAWLPARRATRIDPVEALRSE